ncbi:MAG: hypothetical protein WBC85_06715 [Planktotalea sp.]
MAIGTAARIRFLKPTSLNGAVPSRKPFAWFRLLRNQLNEISNALLTERNFWKNSLLNVMVS